MMRIGVMLRSYDRPGGIGIYAKNIVRSLTAIDRSNSYLLLYNNQQHIGTNNDLPNVEEQYIPPANQILWDQWHASRALDAWKADIVLNTKFSVPLMSRCKRVMVLHGASWFVHPELYGKLDIFYVRRAMPIYCRAADFLISNSECTTRDFIRLQNVPKDKITTIPLAAGDGFRPVEDRDELELVRKRYSLPPRFLLTVTSYDPRKNFRTLLQAFKLARRFIDTHLVVVGKGCERYRDDFDISDEGLKEAVHFPGWIDQHDLPAIYSMAEVFAFPSVYEEFGIPVLEAMACGCPVVVSNTGNLPELAGDAGLFCDPFDEGTLARHIVEVTRSSELSSRLRANGLRGAARFSWQISARRTLEVLRETARS